VVYSPIRQILQGRSFEEHLWGYKEEEGEMAKYDLDYSMQELTLVR
jgi:hypothetical protein